MDDGGRADYSSVERKGMQLHTQSFTLEVVPMLCNGLQDKWGLQVKPAPNKGAHLISISGNS
jgi:LAGLIDADG DNA endonuclease family